MSPEQSMDTAEAEIEIGLDNEVELSRLNDDVVIMGFYPDAAPEVSAQEIESAPLLTSESVREPAVTAGAVLATRDIMEFPLGSFLDSIGGNPTPTPTPLIVFRAPDIREIPTTVDAPTVRLPRKLARYRDLELGLAP